MKKLALCLCLVLSLVCCVTLAEAALLTPVSVDASSTFYTYNENNLINGSGMSDDAHSGYWADMWLSEFADIPVLTFNLGGLYEVTATNIWQYNSTISFNRGVKDFDILSSIDGINFSYVTTESLFKETAGNAFAQTVLFNTVAQYIRFDVLSNFGDGYTGLSEVSFIGTNPVPEPASMVLLGLGGLGLMGLKRKK